MDKKIITPAMDIIIQAGDARLLIFDALTAMADNDYEKTAEKLQEAQKKMTEAHKIQTDMIQGEAKGEEIGYSLLFTHAQDTLMTIYSELNIAKKLYKVFEPLEKRITGLEKRDL